MRSVRGFTLVEMLMVLIVLGILTGLGLLKYIDLRNTARTAALVADVRAIQIGAINYYADHEAWPPESGVGQVPLGLEKYLSGGLAASLDRTYYVLDYENVELEDDVPLIGVAVESADAKLLAKFVSTFAGKSPFIMVGGRLTYFISGPGGMF